MSDILGFITRISDAKSSTDGGYWFACILKERFVCDGAVIAYSIPENKFVVKVGEDYFDCTGRVTDKYIMPKFPPVEWEWYKQIFPVNALRLHNKLYGGDE